MVSGSDRRRLRRPCWKADNRENVMDISMFLIAVGVLPTLVLRMLNIVE
ncbi:MAG TPA: hypothetical protein VLM41_11715 [Steroidobacteraceae bacterium]|nr:hypothetical protein [Steroidobacteraceae bacterium]